MKIKFEFELEEKATRAMLLQLFSMLDGAADVALREPLTNVAGRQAAVKQPEADDEEGSEPEGEDETATEATAVGAEEVAEKPAPESKPEPAPEKPKRRRRTKAEIEAAKAAEEAAKAAKDSDVTPEPAKAEEPKEEAKAKEDATDLLAEALGAQAKVKFPSPNDFLRESYEKDKDKAKKVCAEFIESVDKPTLADLTDDERQDLCQRMVDAGFNFTE